MTRWIPSWPIPSPVSGGSRAIVFLAACLWCSSSFAVEIVAHRGGYLLTPENTCAAIRACAGAADRIEIDVHVSADGHLVVIHDATVNRTTSGSGAVSNLTLAQLKALDAGAKFSPAFAGERIPTLAEALAAVPPGIPVLLDRKAGEPQNYVDALRAANMISNAALASGGWKFLIDAKELEPGLHLVAVGSGELGTNSLEVLRRHDIRFACWPQSQISQEVVDLARSYGVMVYVPISTGPEIHRFLDMGVDGLIAEDPRMARDIAHGSSSARTRLSRDMVAYWKLDDGLSDPYISDAEDAEGTNTGRLVGYGSLPAWLEGEDARMGGALRFNGSGNYVRIPTSEALDIGTPSVSISLWVMLSNLPSQLPEAFASIYDSTESSYSLYLDRQARELRFKVTDAGLHSARPGIPESALSTGVWLHVVGTYDGAASPGAGLAAIYLDGRLQDVHAGNDATPRSGLTGNVRPGQFAALGRKGGEDRYYFAGAIDDVAVWRRTLLPAEVRQIHLAGATGLPLQRLAMSVWFRDIRPVPDSSDFEIDVTAAHGLLDNEPLRLYVATRAEGPYVEYSALANGRGRQTRFRVSAPAHPHPRAAAPAHFGSTTWQFFQIVRQ